VRPPARYASDPASSRGRLHGEAQGGKRGPRDAFQRDRDRIIHSIPFRRLRHKTQVFVAPDGDHFRVRLTHSLEVAQIGRTIARALGLNEDLTEALCLAHDIGHPPFGHSGEEVLQAEMAGAGGFDRAVVDHLEAIRVNPRSAAAHDAFARLWLAWPDPLMHNPGLAADLAERACELSGWGDPACLATLAAARRLADRPGPTAETGKPAG